MSIQLQEVQGKNITGPLNRQLRGVFSYRNELSELHNFDDSCCDVVVRKLHNAVINLENTIIELYSFIREEEAKREALAKLLFNAFPDLKDIEILEETLEARKKEFKEKLK